MGSKRLTPTRVGKMASKCLLFVVFGHGLGAWFPVLKYFLQTFNTIELDIFVCWIILL